MLALYICIAVIVVFLVLSLIKVNVHFSLAFEDKLEGLELQLEYLFIRKTIFPSSPKEAKEEVQQGESAEKKQKTFTVKLIYYLIRELKDDIFKLLEFLIKRTVKVENFTLEARIGTDDPMITGMAIGSANGFVYNLLALLDRHKLLKKFSVSIEPEWNHKIIKGGIYIKVYTNIFTVLRLVFIALGLALKTLWLMRKFRKGI